MVVQTPYEEVRDLSFVFQEGEVIHQQLFLVTYGILSRCYYHVITAFQWRVNRHTGNKTVIRIALGPQQNNHCE